MIRKLGGIAVGIAVAVAVMMLAESSGYRLFGLDSAAETAGSDAALPPGLQLFVVAGWFLGALAGSYAADWVSRAGWTGWIVAAVIALGVVLRAALSITPTWMLAAGVIAPLLAALLAQRLPGRRGPIA